MDGNIEFAAGTIKGETGYVVFSVRERDRPGIPSIRWDVTPEQWEQLKVSIDAIFAKLRTTGGAG